jgi:hypothetical protein
MKNIIPWSLTIVFIIFNIVLCYKLYSLRLNNKKIQQQFLSVNKENEQFAGCYIFNVKGNGNVRYTLYFFK